MTGLGSRFWARTLLLVGCWLPLAVAGGPAWADLQPTLIEARELLRQGKLAEALDKAKEGLQADAGSTEARLLVGEILLELSPGNVDEAAGHFEAALAAEPRNAQAKVGVARVRAARGDFDGAIELLEDAAQFNPRPEEVYYHLGLVLEKQGRFEEAVAAYRKALERLLR